MKRLISDVGGLKTFLEIRELDTPTRMKYLRISTFYDGARDPYGERTRFDMCLEDEHFQILKDIINEM